MGANFETMKVDGSKTRDDVKKLFADAQDQDRYENGHSYSGGFGMTTGLTFQNKTFDNYSDAYDWLCENTEKWEAALCVTFKDESGNAQWLIGALCAS